MPEDVYTKYTALSQKISAFMQSSSPCQNSFNELALAAFSFQYQYNIPYKNYCDQLGRTPSEITHWSALPSLSTDAFKLPAFPLFCFPKEEALTYFKTSGTTQRQRGLHYFYSLDLYRLSLRTAWEHQQFPHLPRLFLTQSPQNAPHSSLSYMMGVLQETNALKDPFLIDEQGTFLFKKLREQVEKNIPIFLIGTALAFLHLFNQLGESHFPLPPGSQIMETGGYKGLKKQLEKKEFYALLQEKFALPTSALHNEYSMTELSSQFYSRDVEKPHHVPHWTRLRILHPETHQEVDLDQTGYLEIIDLANLGSLCALKTHDLAIRKKEGFQLIGRDPQAISQGCSLTADQFLTHSKKKNL